MRALVILVITLVACIPACTDGGVVIVVDPMNPAVEHVRLYVGQGDTQRPLYLQTSNSAATAPTANRINNPSYWARDPFNSSDFVDLDTPGDSVGFTFVDAGQHGIPAIIAVGYDANYNVVGTAFLAIQTIADDNDFTLYHMPLHGPVTPLDGISPRQLGLWSVDNQTPIQDAACAGLVVDTAGFQTKAFIVTDGDEDCDGLPTGSDTECDPDAYLSTRPANRGELSCLVAGDPVYGQACYLGGPSCTDGQARDMNACDPTGYCVPADVCDVCPPKTPNALDCATAMLTPVSTTYTCFVSFNASSGACTGPIPLQRPPTGGFNCNSVQIRDGRGRFDDHAEYPDTLRFDIRLDEGCNITLQPSGKRPVTPGFTGTALVALELDNGNGLGVPIVFRDSNLPCGPPMACVPESALYSPELTQCMARWGAPMPLPALVDQASEISDPTLPDDMSELYFTADGVIVVSTRDPVTNAWLPASPVFSGPIGTLGAIATAPNITPDGRTLYFVVTTNLLSEVYIAKRSGTTWSPPLPITPSPSSTTPISEVSPDETQTHFIAALPGFAGSSDRLAEIVKTGSTYSIQPLALNLNSLNDVTPFLTPDGLHLYFASDDATDPVGEELFVASRNSLADPFDQAVRLSELGSPGSDRAPWVSRDGHTMYFVSTRNGGLLQLFESHR
jgi:hypothetical protein